MCTSIYMYVYDSNVYILDLVLSQGSQYLYIFIIYLIK